MSRLETISKKVLNYSDIPEYIREGDWTLGNSCDCYILYNPTIGRSLLDNWIIKEYPEIDGEEIFIYID